MVDPEHPSHRFKKLGGYENVWSVRINEQYRAVGEREGDTIEWAWIGSHNEFDSRFGSRVSMLERMRFQTGVFCVSDSTENPHLFSDWNWQNPSIQ